MIALLRQSAHPSHDPDARGLSYLPGRAHARIDTQDYLARELGLDGEPDRPVTVERRPEDVFDPAAIASFEGKDVTYTHPPEMLSPENQSAYSKGHAENVRREGDFLVADLHLKDPTLISEVRTQRCGYF